MRSSRMQLRVDARIARAFATSSCQCSLDEGRATIESPQGLVVVVVVVEDDDEGGAGDTCTCVGGSLTLVEVQEKHPVVATQLPILIVRMKVRCSRRFIRSR